MKLWGMGLGMMFVMSCGANLQVSSTSDVTVGKGLWASILSVPPQRDKPAVAMAVGCPVRDIYPVEAWRVPYEGPREKLFLVETSLSSEADIDQLVARRGQQEVLRIAIHKANAWTVAPYGYSATVLADKTLLPDGGGAGFTARRLNEEHPQMNEPGGRLAGILSSCSR